MKWSLHPGLRRPFGDRIQIDYVVLGNETRGQGVLEPSVGSNPSAQHGTMPTGLPLLRRTAHRKTLVQGGREREQSTVIILGIHAAYVS